MAPAGGSSMCLGLAGGEESGEEDGEEGSDERGDPGTVGSLVSLSSNWS